jgi:hypothetical protein
METIKLTEDHREVIEWLALSCELKSTIYHLQEWLDAMKYGELLAHVLEEAQRQEEIRQAKIDLFLKHTSRG